MFTPDTVLRAYMKEMNAWERRCAARMEQCMTGKMDFDEATNIGIAEYLQIFGRYCSQSKAQPRDFHFTEPPDYDPEREEIVITTGLSHDRVQILTQQNYSHRKRHVFSLALEGAEWKLVKKQVMLEDGTVLDACL